jgi:hypothetical protein
VGQPLALLGGKRTLARLARLGVRRIGDLGIEA